MSGVIPRREKPSPHCAVRDTASLRLRPREDVTPETFDVAAGPFALVFGTEHAGISDEVIAGADEFLRIPMCGMVESLNVSASAAILIYMLSERMRLTGGEWRMTDAQQAETLFGWMRRSVKDADAILQRKFKD